MQTKSYEEMNLDLQKKLNKENEIYYSNFLIYMRTHTFTKNNGKVEVLLLDILQDILQAQSEGLSAESYFGKNPKLIADELIKELPSSFFDTLKLILIAAVTFCVASFFPALLSPEKSIDLGSLLLATVIVLVFSFSALKIIGNSAYNNQEKRSEFVFIGFFALFFCVIVAVLVFVSTPLTLSIGNTTGVWLILIVFCLLTYLFVQERDKKIWIPFVPVVIGYSVCGILIRMNFFSDSFNSNNGKTVLAVISAAVWGVFCILMFMSQKKARQ